MKNTRSTHYKLRNMGTDTADCGPGKFTFHDTINTLDFATNSCVTRKDTADCVCSRFVFRDAIILQKPVNIACHGY